ncbi:MAG: hypothetical protein ACOYKA_05395, partial [Legionellaceae bacterium]
MSASYRSVEQAVFVNRHSSFRSVYRYQLFDSSCSWIGKQVSSLELAKKEQIAQEFFRMILPRQPKTRVLKFETGWFVLSEEVSSFEYLPRGLSECYSNGAYVGLGETLLLSMYLGETDLNEGNIGLNHKKEIIKIDGEQSFEQIDHTLRSRDIQLLPFIDDFKADRWLDLKLHGLACHDVSDIVDKRLCDALFFRQEVNRTILTLCLLTKSFITRFVQSYGLESSTFYVDYLVRRTKELMHTALLNPSFRAYLLDKNMTMLIEEKIKSLLTFKTSESHILVPFFSSDYVDFLNEAKQQALSLLRPRYLDLLLNKIKLKTNERDEIVLSRVRGVIIEMNLALETSMDADLVPIKSQLDLIWAAVSSQEVSAVIQLIQDLQGRFWSSDHQKANRIETALLQMSLEDRPFVLSQRALNPVQEALASHSDFWRRGRVYKNEKGELEPKKVAKTYARLQQGLFQGTTQRA